MTKRLTTKQYRGFWPEDICFRGGNLSVREQYQILAMTEEQRVAEYGIYMTPAIVERVRLSVAWWQKYDADRRMKTAR